MNNQNDDKLAGTNELGHRIAAWGIVVMIIYLVIAQ